MNNPPSLNSNSEDWGVTVARLNEVRIFDYFKNRMMPNFVEPLLCSFLDSFCLAPKSEHAKLHSIVLNSSSPCFAWYARKMAGQAVRERSEIDLWRGLVSVSICGVSDRRDAMALLALLFNSTIHLGREPKSLFYSMSDLSTPQFREAVRFFVEGPPSRRDIGNFHYSEGMGPLGFDYIPLLPEFGGPVPI